MRKISLAERGRALLTLAACARGRDGVDAVLLPAEPEAVRGEVEQPATVAAKGWEFRALALPKLGLPRL